VFEALRDLNRTTRDITHEANGTVREISERFEATALETVRTAFGFGMHAVAQTRGGVDNIVMNIREVTGFITNRMCDLGILMTHEGGDQWRNTLLLVERLFNRASDVITTGFQTLVYITALMMNALFMTVQLSFERYSITSATQCGSAIASAGILFWFLQNESDSAQQLRNDRDNMRVMHENEVRSLTQRNADELQRIMNDNEANLRGVRDEGVRAREEESSQHQTQIATIQNRTRELEAELARMRQQASEDRNALEMAAQASRARIHNLQVQKDKQKLASNTTIENLNEKNRELLQKFNKLLKDEIKNCDEHGCKLPEGIYCAMKIAKRLRKVQSELPAADSS
jgi:hypothetical protein